MFTQDPTAVLDYIVDWSRWLTLGVGGVLDTISTSTWTVSDPAITLSNQSSTAVTATTFVTGGVTGRAYTLTNHIVTTGGRTDSRAFTLTIVSGGMDSKDRSFAA